jgi:hypothetical protein
MRRSGLFVLGIVTIPLAAGVAGAAGCGSAEAAPSPTPTPMSMAIGAGRRASRAGAVAPGHRFGRGRRVMVLPVVHACQRPTHVSATAGGKYAGLILRLHVPGDCAGYGAFHDYGAYGATSYAGHQGIPAGYWVYHYPFWHVYQQQVTSVAQPPAGGAYCTAPVNTSANANGKYRVLLRRLHVPGDCATYGSFNDYGSYGATSYAGHANLPAGYWVYRYPYWYLWSQVGP